MNRAQKKSRAAVYRNLAREAETDDFAMSPHWWSCNQVREHFIPTVGDSASFDEREKYQEAFNFPKYEMGLWEMSGRNMQNIRVLALCFMAAMVEAGDA